MVSMLEILIDGSKANLPSQADLSGYGIYTITVTEDGSRLAAYVPLQVVDGDGGSRAAFYAKMLYLPGTDWGNAQQVRLVWVLQALVDVCETYEDNECSATAPATGTACDHLRRRMGPDRTQRPRRSWYGHGLHLRGPGLDANLNDDLALYKWPMGWSSMFLAGRAGPDEGGMSPFTKSPAASITRPTPGSRPRSAGVLTTGSRSSPAAMSIATSA